MRATLPLLLLGAFVSSSCGDGGASESDDTGRTSIGRDSGGRTDGESDTGLDVAADTGAPEELDTSPGTSPDTSEDTRTIDTRPPEVDTAPDLPDPVVECPEDDPDSDGDGVCDSEDVCPDGDDTVDSDGDGAPDDCDICLAGHDEADHDGDGVPNACDPCQFSNPDDSDGDGVCDDVDLCLDGDDTIDVDMDGIPDACDESVEICDDEIDNDGDEVVDCDDTDCARHTACSSCDVGFVMTETGSYYANIYTDSGIDSECGSSFGGGPDFVVQLAFPTSGTYCFDTLGTDFGVDTVLSLRDSCDEGGELDCNDDGSGFDFWSESQLEVDYSAGESLFLVLEGWSEFDYGYFELNVYSGPCSTFI
jgi:hypothetical protein